MQIRPRRLLKQLSQRTGISWFRGPNLIRVRDCDEAGDMTSQPALARDGDERGLDYASKGVRRAGPYVQ